MLKLILTNIKMLVRNRQFLFWSLMFPLMFIFIFGLFFGKNSSGVSVDLANKSDTKIATTLAQNLKESSLFKVKEVSDLSDAKNDIQKSQASVGIEIPSNFGLLTPDSPKQITVLYDPGNAQVGAQVTGFLNVYLTQLNYQIQQAQPIFTLNETTTIDRPLTYFDFVLAGILGLALMNSSIIGISVSIAKYREDKILKRITTTPLASWKFILAESLSRLLLNFFQIGIVLTVGVLFFDGHIYGNVIVLLAIAMLGALLFQLFGFVVASFTKTTDAAQGMATAITIPMMFLAGVFFPIDQLPKWIYSVVQYLPLAPLLKMLRVISLEAKSPLDDPANFIIVITWIVAALIISIWKFRLTEE